MTLLEFLSREPTRNAWQIQDLTVWAERTKVFQKCEPGEPGFGYMLHSGHPSCRVPTLILGGNPEVAARILRESAPEIFLVRETEEEFGEPVMKLFPKARLYPEWRMEVTRETFRPVASSARRLTLDDVGALAKFNGIPPERAGMLEPWIRGAVLLGVFDGPLLVATASTIVRTPQTWGIAAVQTLPSYRGRGYATQVTGALAAEALQNVPSAILTVLKDNPPALRVYEKLGFARREGRVWIDHGANSAP